MPRASTAHDSMPPPPSPSKITAAMKVHQTQLEAEIQDLRSLNADLEARLRDLAASNEEHQPDLEALRVDLETAKTEADELRHQLSAAQADVTRSSDLATEAAASESQLREELALKARQVLELEREMKIAAERAAGELDAGMEAKRLEIKNLEERAANAEFELSEQTRLVEELTVAGQVSRHQDSRVELH